MSLSAELNHKRELSNITELSVFDSVFVPILNYGHWTMANDWKSAIKRQRWNFCKEFTVWHLATKCAAVNFVKPWMSSHFSKWRDPSYVDSTTCPECPRKIWRDKFSWLRPRESGPKVVPGPDGAVTSPTFAGSRLGVELAEHLKLLLTVRYSISIPRAGAYPTIPRG